MHELNSRPGWERVRLFLCEYRPFARLATLLPGVGRQPRRLDADWGPRSMAGCLVAAFLIAPVSVWAQSAGGQLIVTNGTLEDRVELVWDLDVPGTSLFSVQRDGADIAVLASNVRQFADLTGNPGVEYE